jgi:hypothetical protein
VNGEVDGAELLARYAVDKSYYRPSDGSVRHNAFMPGSDGATSVFRISEISEDDVWIIGRQYVGEPRGKRLLGRAQITAGKVFAQGLQVQLQEPPPRHAGIVGWPDEQPKQKEIALRLAAEAAFIKASR